MKNKTDFHFKFFLSRYEFFYFRKGLLSLRKSLQSPKEKKSSFSIFMHEIVFNLLFTFWVSWSGP